MKRREFSLGTSRFVIQSVIPNRLFLLSITKLLGIFQSNVQGRGIG